MREVYRPATFPTLSGESLSRQQMTLPEDFEGEINLVFVAFRRRHQDDVDEWLRRLGDIESSHSGLAVYEVPLLIRYPRFYRQWIDDGMRSGIPDPRTRSRTVTVYTNRRSFLDRMGLPDESEILLVLLDREAGMVWTHVGAHTEQASAALRAELDRLGDTPIRDR